MNKKYKTLILMPYLPLKGSFSIAGVKLWSCKNDINNIVDDEALKCHIKRLVSCYRFSSKSLIDNPCVVSISGNRFLNPSSLSIAKIEAIKKILLASGILQNNSWSFITSDNFETYYQRFNVGDDGIATVAGAIHTITAGGYKIGEIEFIKPDYINISSELKIDFKIVRALEDCLLKSETDSDKNRIIQSLNPFFNAYRNSPEQSWSSRILLLMMAFELLFGETGREVFRKNIRKYSVFMNNLIETLYPYPIIVNDKIMSAEDLTLNQIWAEEFYKLRNKIIHGKIIYNDDFLFVDLNGIVDKFNPHFYIAVNFFMVCLLNKLKELEYDVPHFVIKSFPQVCLFEKDFMGLKDSIFKIENIDTLSMFSRV